MEILRTNVINFSANHRSLKKKMKPQVSDADFSSRANIKEGKKTLLLSLGIIATGAALGALLINKKPGKLKQYAEIVTKKIKSIIPFKKKINPINPKNSQIVRGEVQTIEKQIPPVKASDSIVKTGDAEVINPTLGAQKIQQAQEPIIPQAQEPIIPLDNGASANAIEAVSQTQGLQEGLPGATIPDYRRSGRNIDAAARTELSSEIPKNTPRVKGTSPLPDRRRRGDRHRSQAALPDDMTAQIKDQSKLSGSAVGKIKPEAEIAKNQQINLDFLRKRMQSNSALYSGFGIDENIEAEFLKLDPNTVKEFNDDEFLSFLLAPGKNLSLKIREMHFGYPGQKKSMRTKLNSTILKNTKAAKAEQLKARKMKLNDIVDDIAFDGVRIARMHELEEYFTPEDIHKIFNGQNEDAKNLLLKWLMHLCIATNEAQQKQNSEKMVASIKNLIA